MIKNCCAGTGHRVDDLFETLVQVGFTHEDVRHLEYLSDRRVLQHLEGGFRYLRKNQVEDVTLYLNTLAGLLEEGVWESV